eukprot:scaffold12787_cov96-Amphora_coffeaeformis.AAC.1
MAASFQAAARQTGTQVAGTINIPPPAGPQSRRASLAGGTNPRLGFSTATGPQLAGYTPQGAPIYVNVPSHGGTKHSKAEEFAKGGRRSVSDYTAFSNREGWSKWQRALLGTALDHKTEKVLDYQYIPDPNDTDACELFDSQKRLMYSVFTKTITEPSAVDILRNYSNPNSPDFKSTQTCATTSRVALLDKSLSRS